MKKIIYTLGIIAASAFVFSACQKELATNDEIKSEEKLVTISFTAEKAGLDTKTAVVEDDVNSVASYIWTAEDIANIKLFTVEAGAITGEVDSPVITKVSDTQLTISATVAANATYTFRAILCDPASYTGSGDDYTSRKPKIKTSQTPNGTSNFDPTADILVSDDKEVTVGEGVTTTGDMLLSFRRQVVVNKMTLKNLVEGEKISKVVVKSDKYLTGYLNDGAIAGQEKELSLNYSDVAVPASGQFVVYFLTMENTAQTLTVEVTTDQNTYSKDFTKTIDFNLGEFTKFGVALPAGTPVSDLSGYYLIGTLATKWQLMDSGLGSNTYYPKYTTNVSTEIASVSESDFSGIANLDPYIWKVEAYDGAYSIKSLDTDKYLSYSGSSNAAYAADELSAATKFTINLTSTVATIESSNVTGRKLKYNSSSPRFAFYTSAQTDIFMIPVTVDTRTPVTLSFAETAPSYDTDHYGDFTGQAVTADPDEAAITGNITWSIDDTADNITSSFNTSTGALVLNGNTGSATVTASFAGDGTYRAAEASYTITVTPAGATTYYYEEMTSAPADWTAETYIIIAGTSVLNTSATSSWGGYTTITKEADGSVKSTAALELLEVTATGNSTDGYKLCFTNATDAYYLNPLTSKSFALSTTANGTLDLAVDKIANHSNSSWLLRLNGASGFRWYSSTTGTVAVLYKKVAK